MNDVIFLGKLFSQLATESSTSVCEDELLKVRRDRIKIIYRNQNRVFKVVVEVDRPPGCSLTHNVNKHTQRFSK